MVFVGLALVLFVTFVSVFLFLMPRPSAAGALLHEVTRPVRTGQVPAWRAALNVDYLAKPFTLGRSLFAPAPDPILVRRLALAGYRKPAHADIFLGARLALPASGGLLVALFASNNAITYFILAVGLGFFVPDFWLSWAINKRRDRIRLSLPDGLDFLAICLEAGIGLDQAIVRLARELRVSHPDLADELLQVNFEQRAGVTRITAWKNFADRVDLENVRSFVGMLVQTDRFGTPISKSLGSFSDALRVERRQRAEEMAAKTTVKLLFPLILFIAPSMGIVLIGPAVLTLIKNFEQTLR
ncbi:MAG: type II secretion system F family protein [Acidobacteria bacterium]|nr:type II secretion system F family protein [Acidobacteriota bacterium]